MGPGSSGKRVGQTVGAGDQSTCPAGEQEVLNGLHLRPHRPGREVALVDIALALGKRDGPERFGVGALKVEIHAVHCREDDQQIGADSAREHARGCVLVDDGFNAAIVVVFILGDRDAPSAGRHDDVPLRCGFADHLALNDPLRLGRWNEASPPAPGVLADDPPKLALALLSLLLGEKWADRLGRFGKRRVVLIDDHLGDDRDDESADGPSSQAVEQLQLEVVAEAAFGLGHMHIKRQHRERIAAMLISLEQSTDLRTVAVGDDDPIPALNERHELLANGCRVATVVFVGAGLPRLHEGVPTERYDDGGAGCTGSMSALVRHERRYAPHPSGGEDSGAYAPFQEVSMSRRKILILGAAGRDFHDFNTVFRSDDRYEVVAFTATQIPKIEGRQYPAELAGPLYPKGIPIESEDDLERLIEEHGVDECVFSYSDVSYEHVGHVASRVLAAGADFRFLGMNEVGLSSPVPVVAVTAVRTGSGKSPTTRSLVRAIKNSGRRVVVVRHPMPYGDLAKQRVQRFETIADLDAHQCTFEEREEYESHIEQGTVVFAGVDYQAILDEASREADVIFWDGGNNDIPFFRPDVWVTVADPLRAGHESTYFPGEVNVRRAHIVVLNKCDRAEADDIEAVERAVAAMNPSAMILRSRSVVTIEGDESLVRGKRVLCIEDGPTLTHGGMSFGAGQVAAEKFGAREVVDPRPYAVGSIRQTLDKYPQVGRLLPAMGYYPEQIADLEASVRATDCDVVLVGTPFNLAAKLNLDKPAVRVRYEVEDVPRLGGEPKLGDAVVERLNSISTVGAS